MANGSDKSAQRLQLLGIILPGVFALASAGFSLRSSAKATQASNALESYKIAALQLQTFSQRVHESVQTLAGAYDAKTRVAGTIDILSLYSLSKGNIDEKRALIYVAAASNNPNLIRLFTTYLKKSPDPADVTLQPEFREALTDNLNATDTASAAAVPTASPNPSNAAAQTGKNVAAAATTALSQVTPNGASGWMYLGEAAGQKPGTVLQFPMIRPNGIPQVGATASLVQAAQYVHLRDANITPSAAALGAIQGVVAPGRSIRPQAITFVPLANGKFAAWARVQLCPAGSATC